MLIMQSTTFILDYRNKEEEKQNKKGDNRRNHNKVHGIRLIVHKHGDVRRTSIVWQPRSIQLVIVTPCFIVATKKKETRSIRSILYTARLMLYSTHPKNQ